VLYFTHYHHLGVEMKTIVVTYDDTQEFREAHYASEAWEAIRESVYALDRALNTEDIKEASDTLAYVYDQLGTVLCRVGAEE
jgi:hypothetical protein